MNILDLLKLVNSYLKMSKLLHEPKSRCWKLETKVISMYV